MLFGISLVLNRFKLYKRVAPDAVQILIFRFHGKTQTTKHGIWFGITWIRSGTE